MQPVFTAMAFVPSMHSVLSVDVCHAAVQCVGSKRVRWTDLIKRLPAAGFIRS
jgi:hypothetical protein